MRKFIYLVWAILLAPVVSFGWDAEKKVSEYPAGRDYAVLNNTKFLALFGDTAYIVWERWVNDSTPSPAFSRWTTDNGNSWSPAHHQIFGDGHYMTIAVSKGVGHLMVYKCDPPLGTYYYRSTDCGQSWTFILALDNLTNAWNSLTVDRVYSDLIHAVWQGFSAPYPYRYRQSFDNGVNWESMQTLAEVSSVTPIPSIAAICNYVYFAYIGGTDILMGDTVCFMRSIDKGVTWETPIVLGQSAPLTTGVLSSVCVACRNEYVYVVWNGGDFFGAKIKYRRSTDYGQAFESEQEIADGSYANLYALGPYVYMAYAGTDGSLKFMLSSDHGASWGGGATPSASAEIGYTPGPTIVVAPSGDAHIAWTDVRDAPAGDSGEIYYIHGTVPAGIYEDTCPSAHVEETKHKHPSFSVSTMPWGFSVKYELNEPGVLRIYNIAGKLVKTRTITHSCEVKMGELPSGIYFLTLKTPTHYLKTKGIYLL